MKHTPDWPCLTDGITVWYRNLKCASTYFGNFLVQELDWVPIEFKNIEWDRHKVFGHIMEPRKRWFKGMAECIHNEFYLEGGAFYGIDFLALPDHQIRKFITMVPWLDEHSMPYTVTLGKDIAYKIDWIPVDLPLHSAEFLTRNYLHAQGRFVPPQRFDGINKHESGDRNRQIYERIKTIIMEDETQTRKTNFNLVLQDDINLYNDVVANLDLDKLPNWSASSWLNHITRR